MDAGEAAISGSLQDRDGSNQQPEDSAARKNCGWQVHYQLKAQVRHLGVMLDVGD